MRNKAKKMLTLLLMSFISIVIQAQGIDFKKDSWQEIKIKAKAENKLIFVDVYAIWCGPCKTMDKHVFNNEKVGTFYNTNFIPFKMDAEKGEGPDFAKEYNITSYPTLLFIDGEGKQIMRKGSMDVDEFLLFGQQAFSSEERYSTMTSLYNKGKRDSEFILKYLALLKGRGLPTEQIALGYLATIGQDQWISVINLEFIRKYIKSPYCNVIEFLAKNKEPEFAVSQGDFSVYYVLFDIYKEYIKSTIIKKSDDSELYRLLSKIKLEFYPNEKDYLTFFTKKEIAKRDKDWKNYTKECITHVNNKFLNNNLTLNNWAWVFYKNKNIKDEYALTEALKWSELTLKNEDKDHRNYVLYLDTYASLLYKLGRNEEALKVANNAISLAEKFGLDSTITLNLINKINTSFFLKK